MIVYLYAFIISFLFILLYSIFEFFFKKKKIFFFFEFKVNFLIYFPTLFFFIYIFFIFSLEIFLLTCFFFKYLSPNLKIFIESFLNIFLNSTVFCVGVPKLVDEIIYELNKDCKTYNSQLRIYKDNSSYKTLLKYNFDLLEHKKNFFNCRNTIIEIDKICQELKFINNFSIEAFQSIIISFQKNENLQIFNQDLQKLYYENLFKLKTLELCNEKLGIPLYKNLYNLTFISNKVLPQLLSSKINPILVYNNICPFLNENILNKKVNYYNTELSIILGKNNYNSLIVLKPCKTVDATNNKYPTLTFDGYKVLKQKIINDKVISEINYEGKRIKVIDLEVKTEAPNVKKVDILKGGVGIIESYVNFNKFMLETKKTLSYLNIQINYINNQNKKTDFLLVLEKILQSKKKFLNSTEDRIINKKLIYNPNTLFLNEENQNISLKLSKINDIFLKELNNNIKILKNIDEQQSNLKVNYQKLIKNINNPQKQEYYLKNKIKNQILQTFRE